MGYHMILDVKLVICLICMSEHEFYSVEISLKYEYKNDCP